MMNAKKGVISGTLLARVHARLEIVKYPPAFHYARYYRREIVV